ncbi:MAG: hypothetical protein JWN70_6820 [Planctomycetaceae bacterium]|nr:hypothetical protein [Planctomycetaceae bacterium]
MQMLHAGGHPILCDDQRLPDPDNPRGYFELEKVRSLERDATWMADAEGKAIKVVSFLLGRLPPGHEYRVIFMQRDLGEVLASQARMLERRGQPAGLEPALMRAHFERHLESVTKWMSGEPQIRVYSCEYAAVLRDPEATALAIAEFLETPLDIKQMVSAVDPTLYRQRV